MPLFKWRPDKAKTRAQEQLLTTKRDRHLFSTLYIVSQVPPLISDNGKLRLATKSDLLPCLEYLLTQTAEANSLMPEEDMIVLDRPVCE